MKKKEEKQEKINWVTFPIIILGLGLIVGGIVGYWEYVKFDIESGIGSGIGVFSAFGIYLVWKIIQDALKNQ